MLSSGSLHVMVNCCLGIGNITDGVFGVAGGAGNRVGKYIVKGGGSENMAVKHTNIKRDFNSSKLASIPHVAP